MSKNSKKQDGRGRSPGSQAKQFSRDRQPPRRRKRKPKIDPAAADLLHKMIYEKIPGSRNGKKVRVPFIDAFLNSMRRNVLEAKAVEQIRYFKELTQLGVFDFEDYKERLFQGMKNYYRKVVSSNAEQADLLKELGDAYKQSHILYLFYFAAFVHARQHCTCGACDRGLDYAEFIIHIILKAAFCPEEDESEDGGEDEIPKDHMQSGPPAGPSGPIDKDDDDAFYDGFGFD